MKKKDKWFMVTCETKATNFDSSLCEIFALSKFEVFDCDKGWCILLKLEKTKKKIKSLIFMSKIPQKVLIIVHPLARLANFDIFLY